MDPLLNRAIILARKRDYDGALKTLKDEEDRYYGSFKYYYLYGVICLYSGNFLEAHENFNLARKIKISDPNIMLGFAVLYLRKMNTVQAVHYYLEVQEKEPKNRIARKALTVIRKYSSSEALSDWMANHGNLSKLFPHIPSPQITLKTIIKTSLIFVASLILVSGILIGVKALPSPFKSKNQRSTAEYILSSSDKKEPVQNEGFYRYILTRDQALTLYDRALSLFSAYRDEAAKVNINRILESNASEALKSRARLLLQNTEVPGFDNFKRSDNPSITEVKDEPVIYRDVYVIWRGMATNIEVTDEHTSFQFLVGYDTRTKLEGIIPVIFDIPVSINYERPLEVLGKIKLGSSYSDIWIEGLAIHQSGRLEN
ncbi:MAG: tetratricopeptide repeat protein [Treponema sp.]|nr:tetratricopeptide repeat protein [Treponema sp.]